MFLFVLVVYLVIMVSFVLSYGCGCVGCICNVCETVGDYNMVVASELDTSLVFSVYCSYDVMVMTGVRGWWVVTVVVVVVVETGDARKKARLELLLHGGRRLKGACTTIH